jgi:hypothetical protein
VTGLLVITSQNGLGAVFMLYGPRNDALIVSDPLGEWSSTLGTAGKVNVQFNGTDYVLENKKASDTFQLIMLGGLP